MAHRPVWRCILSKQICTEYCTVRCWEKPTGCTHPEHGQKPIFERYEGRDGQRHLD